MEPDNEAIKVAVKNQEEVPGETVQTGCHLRVA
jgi:hypothetical protein